MTLSVIITLVNHIKQYEDLYAEFLPPELMAQINVADVLSRKSAAGNAVLILVEMQRHLWSYCRAYGIVKSRCEGLCYLHYNVSCHLFSI